MVERYGIWNQTTKTMSGDFLRVDGVDLGEFRDLVRAEYQRAKRDHPENPAFHMRRMWYTGSPYSKEILELARQVRGN